VVWHAVPGPSAISLLVAGAVNAIGLLPASRVALYSFCSSDRNNTVTLAASMDLDSDSVETPFTASGTNIFNCTRTVARRARRKDVKEMMGC